MQNPVRDRDRLERGRALFSQTCAPCHGEGGEGGHAPSLTRRDLSIGATDLALYRVIRDGIPGTAMQPLPLSLDERWEVAAYVRSLGRAAEHDTLETGAARPIEVSFDHIAGAREASDRWLTYSGSLNGWRHSALDQINAGNVHTLRMLWAHQFAGRDGAIVGTPLATDGRLFISLPPSGVAALDAATGEEIWTYEHPLPQELPVCCGRVNRGVAMVGNRVFYAALDGILVALDADTGEVAWQTRFADPEEGYTSTVAPLIWRDLVVVGVSGGEFAIRGFIAAYDATTGDLRWTFHTIPGPGEPGHGTWHGDSWESGGGPTWVTGSADAETGTLYWGVGNPSPPFAGDGRRGDNLYTNSVVALDAATGRLKWHFQFTPHDQHDWDSNQTPILADITVAGVRRKAILWANRNGFYYVLDRETGAFIAGRPYVAVNWASGLDERGRPMLTAAAEVTEAGTYTQPWIGGGTNWLPPSFDPRTGLVFVHATEGSSIFTTSPQEDEEREPNQLYLGSGGFVADQAENVVVALDAATGETRWRHDVHRQGESGAYAGVLSTAGGLVFTAVSGVLYALDESSGRELWRVGLGGRTQATPIAFRLGRDQVIAVAAGTTMFAFGLPSQARSTDEETGGGRTQPVGYAGPRRVPGG